MQARESTSRTPQRAWPSAAHDTHAQPQGTTASQASQPHPNHWPHPMRGGGSITGGPPPAALTPAAAAAAGPGATSRYEPYHYHPHHHHTTPPRQPQQQQQQQQTFEFTIHDLDRCLFGKQDMRVVQINDKPNTTPKQTASASAEDKNKPAKWCDLCQEIRFGECPEHGPLTSLRDPMTLTGAKSYAISTFPDEVGLCISTLPLAGYGVFARHFIPVGTWIGPYEGKKISVDEGMKIVKQGDASFLWEICENYRLTHFLDASDENNSSWMRFIQCARHRGEQNLFVFQYHGSIYYRAFKNILVGEELLVWYDEKYPQYFGIPHELSDLSSRANDTGQPSLETSKATQPEFERRHGDAPHPAHHHYHHASTGSQLIQGGNHKTISNEKKHDPANAKGSKSHPKPPHNHPSNSKPYQGLPGQPPALSQAPTIPGDTRSHHSSTYVSAAGKPHQQLSSSSRSNSPRPGSVNTATFRRDHLLSSSSMLRSMSEDDLRHKRKDRPPSAHQQRSSYEREHAERLAQTVDHMVAHAPPPPPGLLVHHGMAPPSHFSPATSFARIPPVMSVMSVTPLDHSKMNHDEINKMHHHYRGEQRPPAERMREQERMLHMHERIHSDIAEKVRRFQGAPPPPQQQQQPPHEMTGGGGGVGETWHDTFRCKLCGKTFSHSHAFDTHVCEGMMPPNNHQRDITAAATLSCKKCQISFGNQRDFHEHMHSHHRDSQQQQQQQGGGGEVHTPPYWCAMCSRSFSSANNLKNHMKVHEKQQSTSSSAPEHALPAVAAVVKDGSSRSDCVKCGKRFNKPTDLTKHLSTPGECVS